MHQNPFFLLHFHSGTPFPLLLLSCISTPFLPLSHALVLLRHAPDLFPIVPTPPLPLLLNTLTLILEAEPLFPHQAPCSFHMALILPALLSFPTGTSPTSSMHRAPFPHAPSIFQFALCPLPTCPLPLPVFTVPSFHMNRAPFPHAPCPLSTCTVPPFHMHRAPFPNALCHLPTCPLPLPA